MQLSPKLVWLLAETQRLMDSKAGSNEGIYSNAVVFDERV